MADIVLDKVTKRYPDGALAVDHIDLEIADGEFVILVGPSGCGKSTTLNMIAGLEDISEGELRIGGQVVNNKAPKDRDIAMVFQSYALYPHMTVRVFFREIPWGAGEGGEDGRRHAVYRPSTKVIDRPSAAPGYVHHRDPRPSSSARIDFLFAISLTSTSVGADGARRHRVLHRQPAVDLAVPGRSWPEPGTRSPSDDGSARGLFSMPHRPGASRRRGETRRARSPLTKNSPAWSLPQGDQGYPTARSRTPYSTLLMVESAISRSPCWAAGGVHHPEHYRWLQDISDVQRIGSWSQYCRRMRTLP